MASPRLKRKQPNGHGAAMESVSWSDSPPGGVFDICTLEPSPPVGRKRSWKGKLLRVKHTFTPYYDGHLWRKYGEKNIKDSPFRRLYFRCSYHENKGCLASKHVQRENDDDPPLFKVTYMYQHTCNEAPIPAPDIIVDKDEPPAACDGLVLSFGSSSGGHHHETRVMQQQEQHQNHQLVAPSPFLMINFDSSNGQMHDHQQPALPSIVPAAMPSWSSSPFPTTKSPPATDHEGSVFSSWEWDTFQYGLDDDACVSNHSQFSGACSSSLFSWEGDGSSLAHMLTGFEAEKVLF
ncbi:hypothetical protein ACP70R_011557 [Stipagrostis hirtigluma subsp. patula]